MSGEAWQPGDRRPGGEDRGIRRRLALALPISVLAHLALILLGRPAHRAVSDYAVEMEVVEVEPGEPPTAPEEPIAEPTVEPEPVVAPPAPPEAPTEKSDAVAALVEDEPGPISDAGAGLDSDAGAVAAAAARGDGGPGEGTGICFHDVFPFAPRDPSWVLWVSVTSFDETVYEDGLARTLGSFSLYKEMVGATGMDPYTEVEAFLVTAQDFSNWRTYGVVATYNSGEATMRRRLTKNRGDRPGFEWIETPAGYEAALPGEFRWHLVGSGRVLAVSHEPQTGEAREAAGLAPDAGAAPSAIAPASNPGWPRQVTCISRDEKPSEAAGEPLVDMVRREISADSEGHWPVAVIATDDPRAVGLAGLGRLPAKFGFAMVKAFFTDPIRLEGTVRLDGDEQVLAEIAASWSAMIARTAEDPFLRMAGLAQVFEKVSLRATPRGIDFTMPMTQSQVQAALIFLQLQGEELDRMINRRTGSSSPIR